ncbi:MAG: VCBS repeat-containing protein, partial [Nitrospirae bacterium]|nr:VCBS repeat-containing protein [Nitrospirota bacterium]
ASFTLQPRTLTVTRAGNGSGDITVSPGNLTWSGNAGTATYTHGTVVILIATAYSGSIFTGWGGDCSGTAPTCTLTMTKDTNVTATFASQSRKLTVTKYGSGVGNVTASTGNLTWSGDSGTADYTIATVVTLTATAEPDSTLKAWTGCDTTNGATCVVTMTASKAVTVRFSKGVDAVKGDFDGDGKSDLLLVDDSNGNIYILLSSAVQTSSGVNASSKGYPGKAASSHWHVLATGDFNGDGKADILWQDSSTGDVVVWLMDGTTTTKEAYVRRGMSVDWVFKGVGDFNGDGKSGILWHNTSNGGIEVWLMDGDTIKTAGMPAIVHLSTWRIQAIADFDGDGKTDILWYNTSDGGLYMWFMDGCLISSSVFLAATSDITWQIQAVADLNGDGKADIIWQNSSTGDVGVWIMDGVTVKSMDTVYKTLPNNWQFRSTGDFNGDGKADLLWQDSSTGDVAAWFMGGTTIASTGGIARGIPSNWLVK